MKFERYLTQRDAAILGRLAEQLLRIRDLKFNTGEKLVELITSSILLPINVQKKDCVTLFSEVTYSRIAADEQHSVMVVCPQDANHALARVSVLAPIGMALIGRKVHSVVEVRLPFGHVEFIKILGVTALSAASQEHDDAFQAVH